MTDLVVLKDEIDTDPLVRGYAGMTDAEVAEDIYGPVGGPLNLYRPDIITIDVLIKFLLLDNTYQTDGTDTQDRSILARLEDVDALAVTPTGAVANPWGSVSIGTVTEIQQIKSKALLTFFTLSAQGDLPVDLTDSNFQVYLAGAQSAGCMSEAQETALLALADNLQTRAGELGLGKVIEGDVTAARAL